MLTIFSTPKPFHGHAGIIQRNAIKSWTLLGPNVEVILFGDDAGAAEVAAEFGIRHEPHVLRSDRGTKRLDYMFARAQELSRNPLLCYVNCDIILPSSFDGTAKRVAAWQEQFLMVGQRWNTPVTEPLDFTDPHWEANLRDLALRGGKRELPWAVDYFVFSRGMYDDMPPHVVGRSYWDHWLVWRARSARFPVVDATAAVFAVHQNHDFGHHPGGLAGVRLDPESLRNRRLAGGQRHLYTIRHATHRISCEQIEGKPGSWHAPVTALLQHYSSQAWYAMLMATQPLRHRLGLRRTPRGA